MLKNKPFLFSLSLVAVYLLLGFFAAPRILQPLLEEYVSRVTGRQLQFERIRVDPITLSFELSNVRLQAGDQPLWPGLLIRSEKVNARFNFWRLSPVVSELQFKNPVFEMELEDRLPNLNSQSGKHYPFVRLWQEWNNQHPAAAGFLPYPVKRVRMDGGQLIVQTGSQENVPSTLLTDVELRLIQAVPGAPAEYKLAMTTGGGELIRMNGALDLARQAATGTFELPGFKWASWLPGGVSSEPATRQSGDVPLQGAFAASLLADGLQLELDGAKFQSSAFSICGLEGLLCVNFEPLITRFDARLLVGTSGLLLEKASGQADRFSVQAWLANDRLELVHQFIESASFELEPARESIPGSTTYEAGIAEAMTREFVLDLVLEKNRELQVRGQLNHRYRSAEARFSMTGDLPLAGEIGVQRLVQHNTGQTAVASDWSQLGLKLENPNAGLVKGFIDEQLAGRIVADTLQMEMEARWEGEKLSLSESFVLEQVSLVPASDPSKEAAMDPEWLLALTQNPEAVVILDQSSREVLPANPGSLNELLEASMLSKFSDLLEDPMRSLVSVVGAAGTDPEEVRFAAGKAALDAASAEKLSILGQALVLRPGLAVQLSGVVDPLIDRKALQAEQVSTHVALATAADLAFQSGAELPDFSDPKVHSVIDEFARRRLPPSVLASFSGHFGVADVDQGIKPEGDVDAYYAALFEILVDYAQIPQGALNTLARYRAQAVVDELARLGVSEARLVVEKLAVETEARVDGIPLPLQLRLHNRDQASEPGAPNSNAVPGLLNPDLF